MCGIAFWLEWIQGAQVEWRYAADGTVKLGDCSISERAIRGAFEHIPRALSRRGPDCCSHDVNLPWSNSSPSAVLGSDQELLKLRLCGAVLHLRGADGTPTPQPVKTRGGQMVFNGEIFGVETVAENDLSIAESEAFLGRGISDTQWLAQRIDCAHAEGAGCLGNRIRDALEPLQGPYALVYWAEEEQMLICARDPLGRRSLVYAIDEDGNFCISSVTPADQAGTADGWREVPCGVLCIDLSLPLQPFITQVPWQAPRPLFVSPSWWSPDAVALDQAVQRFKSVLLRAVERRVLTVPEPPPPQRGKVGVLFSGGLDSAVLAALAADALKPGPDSQPIELINIAFESTAPDRLTALMTYEDLVAAYGPHAFRLLCIDVSSEEVVAVEREVLALLGTTEHRTHLDFNIACALYFAARGKACRVCSQSFFQEQWWKDLTQNEDADAALSEQARRRERDSAASAAAQSVDVESQPCSVCNAVSKSRCVHGACKLCCKKLRESVRMSDNVDTSKPPSSRSVAVAAKLACVPVESRFSECPVHRDKGTSQPVAASAEGYPQGDDENDAIGGAGMSEIGAAMYLDASCAINATCRVLLLGHGADELLGGYARHVTALRKRGHTALRDEMLMDLQRLWTRNLGRDDRIISSHGREPRHPFLDEEVLGFVGNLPLASLLGPSESSGPSEPVTKWLLRQVALELGLFRASNFKKRAIQFGSRVAKGSNARHFGANRKARGDVQYTPQEHE